MATKWERYYAGVFDQIVERIELQVNGDLMRKREQIVTQIEKHKNRIPAQLASMVNRRSAPNLGEYTPSWAPLRADWVKKKGHRNFFYKTGRLQKYLAALPVNRIFGATQASIVSDKLSGQVEVIQRADGSTFMRGRVARGVRMDVNVGGGRVKRIRGGQFISTDKINDLFDKSIVFQPFPLIRAYMGTNDVKFVEKILGDDGPTDDGEASAVQKLIGPKSKHRPLLKNYLQWWSDIKVEQIFRSYVK